MKITFTITFLFLSTVFYSQDCGPMTASSTFTHDNLQFNILNGVEAFNELKYNIGIGPDGDLDTREYAPIMYSSNVWAGGEDPNGNIDLAIGDYTDQDWVAGPLDQIGNTNVENCLLWDKVFTVTKEDILTARKIFLEGRPCDEMPESIRNWPARGNPFFPQTLNTGRLADFFDTNGTATYDPCDGDLPAVHIRGKEHHNLEEYFDRLPAKISFYIMNDHGKEHGPSSGNPNKIELAVCVFSYKTQEAEDIIFVKYSVKNYAPVDVKNFHFGNWFDFDLGCHEDDLLGTDPESNMLYVYNSNADDCVLNGINVPNSLFGVSYLGGMYEPFIIENIDGVDSLITPPQGSGLLDTLIRKKMDTSIIPYGCENTTNSTACHPQNAIEYYNLLKGLDTDGTPILDIMGNESKMMFTGNPSDPDAWSLCNENAFPSTTAVTSSSTALLQPGATSEVLLALFHVRSWQEGCPNISALKHKQEEAQSLYDNGFFNIVGPPPPTIELTKSIGEIHLSISDIPYGYSEFLPRATGYSDDKYNFEGIQIYQVKSPNFDISYLNNIDYCRRIYQGDIENEVDDLFNWDFLDHNESVNFIPSKMVSSDNEGIADEFIVDRDQFTSQPLVPGKVYYFFALSYASNNYEQFDSEAGTGQQYPYLASTCGIKFLNSEVLLSSTETSIKPPYNFYNNGKHWTLENEGDELKVELISTNGQKVKSWNLASGAVIDSQELVDLNTGIYFLSVNNKRNNKMYSQKVIQY